MPCTSLSALLAPILLIPLAAGCTRPGPRAESVQPEIADTGAGAPDVGSDLAASAVRDVHEGRYAEARETLDELLLDADLNEAREHLAQGAPADALTAVDRALKLNPEGNEPRLLKADASLRLAEQKIQGGGGSAGLIEGSLSDALEYYGSTPVSAHSLLGASRAAYLLGKNEEALDSARRGIALVQDGESLDTLGFLPQRLYAEQVHAAYARARAEESESAGALFLESEEAFGRLLGRSSDDPWAWSSLADTYEREGKLPEAQATLERGLARLSEDSGLLEQLARVSKEQGGAAGSVAAMRRFSTAHPEIPAGRWQLTVAEFQLALEGLRATPRVLEPAAFTRVEGEFRALRERSGEFTQGALGYEVVCRLARGWCAFHADDLVLAQREFISMNELFERGIEWSYTGELESGIQGLFLVADAYNSKADAEQNGIPEEKLNYKLAAGEVFETLRGLQPDQYLWGNNAGLSFRDTGEDLVRQGQGLCRAARGLTQNVEALARLRKLAGAEALAAGSAEERAAFERAANERFERARTLMERSWKAYEQAATLVPDDVRVVQDAALVLVYYLHHDLERAERWLQHSIEIGGPQIETKKAELALEESPERASQLDSELAQLTEAWGDAHQSMGVLAWIHHADAQAARTWLEKAVTIGPERKSVVNSLLPQVNGQKAREEDDPWDLLNWAHPCQVR